MTCNGESSRVRIALFSEVYWPMVSGVGVTLLRLTDALQARGHAVRVYSATYALPDGVPDRPEVHRSPSVPFFLYPDVQWAFPRLREVVEDLEAFRPDVVHVATEFSLGIAGRQGRAAARPSAHRLGPHRLRPVRRPLRRALGAAGRVALPPLVLRAGPPGALPVADLRGGGPSPRRDAHRASGAAASIPRSFRPRLRSEAYRAAFGVGPDDLLVTYIGRIAREKNLGLLLEAWETLAPERGAAQAGAGGARAAGGRDPAARDPGRPRHRPAAGSRRFRPPTPRPTSSPSRRPPRRSATRCSRRWARGCRSLVAAAGGVLEFAEHGGNAWLVEPDSTPAIVARPPATADRRGLAAPARRRARSPPRGRGTGARCTTSCWRTTRWRSMPSGRRGGLTGGHLERSERIRSAARASLRSGWNAIPGEVPLRSG